MLRKAHLRRQFRRFTTCGAALAAVALVACSGEEELPVAESWQAPAPLPSQTGRRDEHPHAGLGMANPHGEDPHAGLDMDNPHAGMDSAMANFEPPDPGRAIDPDKYLRGTLRPTDETASRIDRGDIIFLSAKPIDPASGEVIGAPVAVDRVIASDFPIAFELSEENMMVAGTAFDGHVAIEARVDGDGEAMTTLAGDVVGSVRAEIPADGLDLVLDSVVE